MSARQRYSPWFKDEPQPIPLPPPSLAEAFSDEREEIYYSSYEALWPAQGLTVKFLDD